VSILCSLAGRYNNSAAAGVAESGSSETPASRHCDRLVAQNPKKTPPEQKARGLGGGNDRIGLDNGGLPHAGQEVVRNVLVENVHPVPDAAVLGVLLPQLVQDVRGVKAGVVAQLPSDHLQTGWSRH
jgi:hypothetical protein